MSKINTYGDEVIYSEVIPGWNLVQLVNLAIDLPIEDRTLQYTVNGFVMGEGDFGLTQCNDPDFVFSMSPLPKLSKANESDLYYETLNHYKSRMYGKANVCYKLIKDSIESGYNPKEDIVSWLMPKMYESLHKGKLRTWTKSNGLIIYQPDLPKQPDMPIYRLRNTKLPIESLKYSTTNWLKQAVDKDNDEIVYIEYSHWDELTDKHYHAIWYLDYVTWKYTIKEVDTYEQNYTFIFSMS